MRFSRTFSLASVFLCAYLVMALGCVKSTKISPVPKKKQPAAKTSPLSDLSVPSLPEWTDRYADGKRGDVRFFNLTRLMTKFKLTRVQAVELQNQYRDLTRKDAALIGNRGFQQALAAVRASQFESKLDVAGLKAAKFIVVFDLDDTLFDQYRASADCHTHRFTKPDGGEKYVHMVPGWSEVIKRIIALGGKVVIFSANLDDRTIRLLSHVRLDDVPITESELISGIMTNSFLIQQEKTEPPGSLAKPRKGRPVIEPSKDLRFFDENLSKVIIVDDNPLRLFQFRHVRVFKKFPANRYCNANTPVEKSAIEKGLVVVSDEIRWAVEMSDANADISFADAYLPFTTLGQITTNWLVATQGWSLEKARQHVVKHPDLVDKRF